MDDFRIHAHSTDVSTEGLAAHGRPELTAMVREPVLAPGAYDLVEYISEYLLLPGVQVRAGETCAYGPVSGWYLTTARYNGDIETLRLEHLYHLVGECPDLVPVLALPPGFGFTTTNGSDVWFDRRVYDAPMDGEPDKSIRAYRPRA